jgi:quercetin dioxygenase-like cupin family protein
MKLVLLLVAAHLFAADNSKFLIWNTEDLKRFETTLHARLGPDHTANLRLTDINGHPVFVVHREATAPAEFHETLSHLIYVISGEATLVVGGELTGKQTTSPDPIAGGTVSLHADSVTGGESKRVATGDVIQIPPRAPHWFKVDTGKQITYLMLILESK